MTTTNDAPAQASVATWHPLDENGLAELRVNGKRVTTFPSYPAAEEAAQRINAALSPPPTVGAQAPSGSGVRVKPLEWRDMTYKGVPEFLAHHPFGSITIKRESDFDLPWVARPFIAGPSNYETLEECRAAVEANYEARILSALASDASPRGEAVAWRVRPIGDKGWHLSHEPPRMGYEGQPLYAHPAPATVEMGEALTEAAVEAAAVRMIRNRASDGPSADRAVAHARQFDTHVWRDAKRDARAALAPATEGRKG